MTHHYRPVERDALTLTPTEAAILFAALLVHATHLSGNLRYAPREQAIRDTAEIALCHGIIQRVKEGTE